MEDNVKATPKNNYSEYLKQYIKDNCISVCIRLNNKYDKDIIDFLQDKKKSTVIKLAIRYFMKHGADKYEF